MASVPSAPPGLRRALLAWSRDLGREGRALALPGGGSTSGRLPGRPDEPHRRKAPGP